MIHKIDNPLEDCGLKFAKDDSGIFEGYASVFNGNDSMNDTILEGAFTKTLNQRQLPVLMLFGHNPGRPIGKWVDMHEDDTGLFVKGEFTPGNTDAQNVRASAIHGAISGLSIGFRLEKGSFEKKEDGGRNIKEIDLVEISAVSMPADQDARISIAKQEIIEVKTMKDAEYLLRDSGIFSRSMATAFVSQLKGIILSESGDVKDEQIAELKAQIMEYERRMGVQSSTDYLVQAINNL